MADNAVILQYAGHRLHLHGQGATSHHALHELRVRRAHVAQIIVCEYPGQEVEGPGPGVCEVEHGGDVRRYAAWGGEFRGFQAGLITSDYDTPAHRKKRQRYNRLQSLLSAYGSATTAIDCYSALQGEQGPPPADAIEMLANACMTFGEQFTKYAQWTAAEAARAGAGSKGGKATRFRGEGKEELQELFDDAVRSFGLRSPTIEGVRRYLNKYKPASERDFGVDAVKSEMKARGLIAGK